MAIAPGDTVLVEYVGRYEDGTVYNTTRRSVAEAAGLLEALPPEAFGPMTVEVGAGELIEGFESALVGLEVGDEVTVTLPPDEAYGERDEDLVKAFPRHEIDPLVGDNELVEGSYLRTKEGTMQEIVHVDDAYVKVDFNHRLAGETLVLEIEVVGVE